jgi:DNA repair exonuclease SbcCD ATPase subunit
MRINSIELKNFCQHESKLVEFSPGLNAIVGPNGVGKSNILNAIGFALTGDIYNEGVKVDNIRQQAAKAAKSYVRLVFQHGDAVITLQRNLRPKTPNAVLTMSNGEEIVGEAAVNTAVEQLLGVPRDVISNMVVVSHGELFGFLQQTQSARLAQFQKLFGLESAEQLYVGIGKYLSTMTVPVITETVAALQVQCGVEQEAVTTMEARMATEIMDPVAAQTAVDDCRARMQSAMTASNIAAALQQINNKLLQSELQIEADTERATRLDAVCEDLQAGYASQDVVAAHAAISNWNAYQAAYRTIAAARQRLEGATTALRTATISLNTHTQQTNNSLLLDIPAMAAATAALAHNKEQLQAVRLIASLESGTDCPTCGAPATAVAERVAEAARTLSILQSAVQAGTEAITYSEAWWRTTNTLTERVANAQKEYDAATVANTGITEAVPVASCETAKITLENAARIKQELDAAVKEKDLLWQSVAETAGMLKQLQEQKKQQEAQLAGYTRLTPQEFEEVSAELSTWLQVLKTIQECETQLAVFRERVKATQRRIANVQTAEATVQRTKDFCALLERVRGIFHKEAAPAIVVHSNLHNLQAEINRQLGLFDADYRVQVADGASFTAVFEGGIVQPVQRLSYGQKVAMAFAFRLALNRTIIPQVNGLFLDEPTAYLDERRIDAFAPVFEQLRQSSQSTGLQCVIVTHERRLSHLFDNVIELT